MTETMLANAPMLRLAVVPGVLVAMAGRTLAAPRRRREILRVLRDLTWGGALDSPKETGE